MEKLNFLIFWTRRCLVRISKCDYKRDFQWWEDKQYTHMIDDIQQYVSLLLFSLAFLQLFSFSLSSCHFFLFLCLRVTFPGWFSVSLAPLSLCISRTFVFSRIFSTCLLTHVFQHYFTDVSSHCSLPIFTLSALPWCQMLSRSQHSLLSRTPSPMTFLPSRSS